MRWRYRGGTNSIEEQAITPRISFIAALDTEGNIYLSLTQINTDTKVMKLYLFHLIDLLNTERPGWTEDTVLLLDNAKYH